MAIRMSNNVIGALNLVTLLLSVPVLITGVWLRSRADGTGCDHFLSTPAVALGAALAAVSLAGLLGACCRATWLLWLYLLATLALALALLCFTAFAFAVTATKPGAGDAAVTATGEGDEAGYTAWMRRHVEGRRSWARVQTCLADAGVCKRLEEDDDDDDSKKHKKKAATLAGGGLSPVESGCCRPPASCNVTSARPRPAAAAADPDCGRWDKDDDKLCYGCESCRAGVAEALRRDWKRAAVVNAVFLALIVAVYAVACCAFRNSRRDNFAYHRSRGWNKQSGDA
ncbi:unnamed protein product [Urochloa decumbens]|uniref:Uncharacterized protein n=1 Tax=Urochloa decumbens TaxID=240449 RepID=A0ABC9C0W2_9POAL